MRNISGGRVKLQFAAGNERLMRLTKKVWLITRKTSKVYWVIIQCGNKTV